MMRVDNGSFRLEWGFSYLQEPVVVVGHFLSFSCFVLLRHFWEEALLPLVNGYCDHLRIPKGGDAGGVTSGAAGDDNNNLVRT